MSVVRVARSQESRPQVVVVLGPTASGKSDLAVELARAFNGEVISADSRQVYRGLTIGTGKVSKHEMKGVRHHLLDVADPRRQFSVTRFIALAKRAIKEIERRGKLPIICGGTGFYIDALINGIVLPEVPPNKKLRATLERKTARELLERLQKEDLERASTIDAFNKRRLIRALEITNVFGKVPRLSKTSCYNPIKIGIQFSMETLRKRIHARLKSRLKRGMLSEARRLHEHGLSWKRMEVLGLEYRCLSYYLQGTLSRKEFEERLEREIYRYAKRQLTWFNRDKSIRWIDDPTDAKKLVRQWLSTSPPPVA